MDLQKYDDIIEDIKEISLILIIKIILYKLAKKFYSIKNALDQLTREKKLILIEKKILEI